jgi:hypothetical protein
VTRLNTDPDPRLLVSATQELLDDWCGPVLVDGLPSIANLGEVLWRGPSQAEPRWWYWKNPDRVDLDLRFAECRDRVCRGLIASRRPVMRAHHGARFRPGVTRGVWVLHGDQSESETFAASGRGGWTCVPGLADLDPSDDTRLSDGSRLVDALALAAVARDPLGSLR